MDLLNTILLQIFSPAILFFILGAFASLVNSDLKIPESTSKAIMIFLLCAIGLEGGIGIAEAGISSVIAPALAAIILGIGNVLLCYWILITAKFSIADAGAIAGHYGAVGAATLIVGLAYLNEIGVKYESFVPALYPLMDSPAIITSIFLTRFILAKKNKSSSNINGLELLKECVFGKAILVMVACMLIGYVNNHDGTKDIMPFFHDMFPGILCLFMLDLGLLAGDRLHEWKSVGLKLTAFALIMPSVHGFLGVLLGQVVGLSAGGATMLGALAMSSSFISAPIAMRTAIPEANISLPLTASVGLTFPFSVIIGIPLCYKLANYLIR